MVAKGARMITIWITVTSSAMVLKTTMDMEATAKAASIRRAQALDTALDNNFIIRTSTLMTIETPVASRCRPRRVG